MSPRLPAPAPPTEAAVLPPASLPPASGRVPGFDVARGYAILGMFIVNFNTVFGSHHPTTVLGRGLALFNGNSSSAFVVLAGLGVALLSGRPTYTGAERQRLRTMVLRRSWFLFGLGVLLCVWWPADILHFYGGYLHVAALLLFVPARYYLWGAAAAVAGFHALLLVVPYETGWDFATLRYVDFWTLPGFVRNTLYNGWNPVFPWLGFFLLGMWLGRLNWQQPTTARRVLAVGAGCFVLVEAVQQLAAATLPPGPAFYFTADYLPPFLPFMASTASFAAVLLAGSVLLANRFPDSRLLRALAAAGRLTLTHYVLHLTLGMVVLGLLAGTPYSGVAATGLPPVSPLQVLLFASSFFLLSVAFSVWWLRRFRNGPLELLMRRFSG